MTRHHVVVGALVDDGRVLLVHRSPRRCSHPDVWDLPGGHVEPGESALEALVRELHEELDIEMVAGSARPLRELRVCSGGGEVHLSVWLVPDWHGAPVNAAPEEHEGIGWFRPADLGTLATAHEGLSALLEEALGRRPGDGPIPGTCM